MSCTPTRTSRAVASRSSRREPRAQARERLALLAFGAEQSHSAKGMRSGLGVRSILALIALGVAGTDLREQGRAGADAGERRDGDGGGDHLGRDAGSGGSGQTGAGEGGSGGGGITQSGSGGGSGNGGRTGSGGQPSSGGNGGAGVGSGG